MNKTVSPGSQRPVSQRHAQRPLSTRQSTPGSLHRTYSDDLPSMTQQRNSARVSKIKNDIRKVYKEYLTAKGKKPKNVQYFKDYCKKKRIKKANWTLCKSVMEEFDESAEQTLPKLHFRVGSETKVFSPNKEQWNDGKVIKIKGQTFCVQIIKIKSRSKSNSHEWHDPADAEGSASAGPRNAVLSSPSFMKQPHRGELNIGAPVEIYASGRWVHGTVTRVKKDSVRVAYGKGLADEKWIATSSAHFRVVGPASFPQPPLTPEDKAIMMSTSMSMTPRSVASSSYATPFKPRPPKHYPPHCNISRTAPSSPNVPRRKGPNKVAASPSKENLIFKLFHSISPSLSPAQKLKTCKSVDRYQAYVYPSSVSRLRLDTGAKALSPPPARWQTPNYPPTVSAPSSPAPLQHLQMSAVKSPPVTPRNGAPGQRRANRKRGDLKIEVHGAMQLRRSANLATVNVAEYQLKTNTVSCTENPIWKETLIFNNFRPDVGKTGMITVVDKSSILGQTVVGTAEFRLLESLNVKKKMTLDIKDAKGKLSGIVVIGQTVVGRRK